MENSIYWGRNESLQRKRDFMHWAASNRGGHQILPCMLGIKLKPCWWCRLPCHASQPTIPPSLSFFWEAEAFTKSWWTSRPAWASHLANQEPASPCQGPTCFEHFVCVVTKAGTYCRLKPADGTYFPADIWVPSGLMEVTGSTTYGHVVLQNNYWSFVY